MARHVLHLHEEPFQLFKSGKKKIESRLYDEKRREISVHDEIEFHSYHNDEKILTKVTSITICKSFDELFSSFEPELFGHNKKEDLYSIYNYYNKEDENRYGVIGIHVEVL